jgi:hypothetical protein
MVRQAHHERRLELTTNGEQFANENLSALEISRRRCLCFDPVPALRPEPPDVPPVE